MVFSAGNGNCDIGDNWMLDFETVVAVAATSRGDVREGYEPLRRPGRHLRAERRCAHDGHGG